MTTLKPLTFAAVIKSAEVFYGLPEGMIRSRHQHYDITQARAMTYTILKHQVPASINRLSCFFEREEPAIRSATLKVVGRVRTQSQHSLAYRVILAWALELVGNSRLNARSEALEAILRLDGDDIPSEEIFSCARFLRARNLTPEQIENMLGLSIAEQDRLFSLDAEVPVRADTHCKELSRSSRIIAAIKGGRSQIAVARDEGVTAAHVCKVVRRYAPEFSISAQSKIDPEMMTRIITLKNLNVPVSDIAMQVGRSYARVKTALERHAQRHVPTVAKDATQCYAGEQTNGG